MRLGDLTNLIDCSRMDDGDYGCYSIDKLPYLHTLPCPYRLLTDCTATPSPFGFILIFFPSSPSLLLPSLFLLRLCKASRHRCAPQPFNPRRPAVKRKGYGPPPLLLQRAPARTIPAEEIFPRAEPEPGRTPRQHTSHSPLHSTDTSATTAQHHTPSARNIGVKCREAPRLQSHISSTAPAAPRIHIVPQRAGSLPSPAPADLGS